MKRAYVDSDQEDAGSERYIDNEEEESKARKKRRGLIEKKRRDRINRCLTELRRLVPAAVDKQGSAKLEKAEILQLTVEHLRNLRNIAKQETVLNTADFRSVGFRECLNEVTTYLHNFQDPNYKDEHKGQLLTNLNAIISHGPSHGSPHVCPPVQAMWPHPRGLGTSETPRYDRTLLPFNTIKQQNLITEKSATMHITGVTLAPEQNLKQIPSHCALFPIDTAMRIVQFPYVPR
ncbi:hairy/enhancer-of-split related with YRPW motif protein 1 [Exaiptasia diaphana]|uniref:BHLH domain-containing protein n=1 Tax=Exaiptasia diaphana TaxID=2652724 RepID=A0A913Y1H4_EXADI|nr:hairy/enhancer-of-split related with YRPW motif protein 1 [Exaiptasia diaphana]